MPHVRLLTGVSGTRTTYQAGQVVAVSGPEASTLVASGRAELVRETPLETAEAPPGPRRRGRPKKTTGGE